MTRFVRTTVLVLGLCASSQTSRAQTVSQEVRNLLRFGDCASLICLSPLTGVHGIHYNASAEEVAGTVTDFLSNAITTSVSNIPLGSTSSGMTFTFDPSGTPIATSQSTGPIFGERSQTLGRRRALFGVSVTGNSFKSIRGRDLSDLVTTLTHVDVDPTGLGNPTYERDTIQVVTDMSASAQVFTAFLGYGFSNRLDVGVAVPVVHLSMEGQSIGTIYNRPATSTHLWENGGTVDTANANASATGIGDVALRAKLNLTQSQGSGTAVMVDVRLPTGSEDDLLGSGNVAVRGLFIASGRFQKIAPHLNAGYLYRAGERENSAVLGTVGFDALVSPALTVAAELLGQWQIGESKILLPAPVTFVDGALVQRTNIPDEKDNVVGASLGGKLSIGPDMTAVANILLPLSNGGVKSTAVWTIGLERNF